MDSGVQSKMNEAVEFIEDDGLGCNNDAESSEDVAVLKVKFIGYIARLEE